MNWFILIPAALVVALMEHFWRPFTQKALRFKGEVDRTLAEPGETVVWSGTVENHSRLSIPFVRLIETFPNPVRAAADKVWTDSHCSHGISQWFVEEKLSLLPRQRCTRTVKLTFPRRGLYRIGSWRLAAGDLLGFRESSRTGEGKTVVVIPERSAQKPAINALGGFLGDVSVRRFILEDPILTVGFRDYTGREPMKAISWTRTASAGTLQVKEYDHTAEPHVMILLSTEGATAEQLEECFRLMRSVCEALEGKKISYGFRTNGNLPGPVGKLFGLSEGLGRRHLNTILYALGCADGTCFYSLRALVRRTLTHRRSNESYILITPALTGEARACARELERAAGGRICVLTGESGVGV